MKLTDIEAGKPLPDKYRFLLFDDDLQQCNGTANARE